MSRKKILLTGSCGFIGGNLVRKLIYEKFPYEIVSIDKIVKSSMLNNMYNNKNHQFYLGDIADEHFINLVFEFEKPDIVLHLAAETFVDASLKEPNKFINSNVLGTQVLVNASVKYGVERFIYISTDEVYGHLTNENDPLWTENSPLNPRNPYSASKAAGELVVKAANQTFGLNYNITRSSNNYGPRQTSEKFIPMILKSIFNNQKIPVFGNGKNMRDWLHVFDNCAGIVKVLESGKLGETYNISANQEYTNIEVVQMVCNIMEKGWDLITYVEDRKGHDFRYGIDSSKLKSLGWETKNKFKDGLQKTCEWFTLNQNSLK